MNNKKGFILMYSVVLMAFVLLLIGSIVTLMSSASSGNIALERQFNSSAELDQIGEYFVHNPTDLRIYDLAQNAGWFVDIEYDYSIDVVSTLKVFDSKSKIILQVQTEGSRIVYWLYGGV